MKKRKAGGKILFFEKIVPAYRAGVYEKFYRDLNIVICHSREKKGSTLKDVSLSMKCENALMSRIYIGRLCFQNIFKPLRLYKPEIVICDFSLTYPSLWLLFLFRKALGYKIILHTHGLKNSIVNNYSRSVWLKLALMFYNRSDAIIAYSAGRAEIIRKLIGVKEKLFVANNTLDSVKLLEIKDDISKLKKEDLKKKHGINSKYVLMFLGRLMKGKNTGLALKSFEILSKRLDVCLVVVGDGSERNLLQAYIHSNPGVIWKGEILDDRINGELLYVSDLLINPGAVGLSIVQSFIFGTPVITCSRQLHGPEIEYLSGGINGVICNPDPLSVASAAEAILKDGNKLSEMSRNAFETAINSADIEKMTGGFKNAIAYLS